MPATSLKRNDPCPCGSGKKYKQCCMKKDASAAGRRGIRPGAAAPAQVDVQAMLRDANANIRALRLDQAGAIFRRILEVRPKSPDALFGLGQILSWKEKRDEGIELMKKAIDVAPKQLMLCERITTHLLQDGRFEETEQYARKALALDRRNVPAHVALAQVCERMQRLDDARTWAEKAVKIDPSNLEAMTALARVLRRQGDDAGARALLERVLERESELGGTGEHVWHEYGFALDRLGAHEPAFAAFKRAGEYAAGSDVGRKLDRDKQQERIDAYRRGFTPELLRKWPADAFAGDGHPRLAFLVGFPRSGTTMTERILAAHPGIATVEEAPVIEYMRRRIGHHLPGIDDTATALDRLDAEQIRDLRSFYWAQLREAEPWPNDTQLVVDKLPLAITEAGIINVILPEARIILALRDPRDVCLSCFMQEFHLNEAMIHFTSWEGTARYYAAVMGLWLHMRELITLPVHEARYERTVTDLEGEARRLLSFLEMPWDDAVLAFHKATSIRHGNTPSYAAVRERVHTRAVARWRHHEGPAAEVEPILKPYLEAFGYA